MADGTTSAVETVRCAVTARTGWRGMGFGIGRFLGSLSGADYLSLTALFFAWVSALAMLDGAPNWGLVAMFGAFGFDKLDGFYARRSGSPSRYGRRIDSFVDVFTYLVTGAVLFHVAMAPTLALNAVVGFALLSFGGLRLVRHNDEGFQDHDGTSYYRGTTVVHTNVLVVTNYLLIVFVSDWTGWLAAIPILLGCPLMVSDYRAFKTVWAHLLVGAYGVVVATFCALLALGVLQP